MKVVGVISTGALFLLLGATVSAFAQEEHHDEQAKPAKQGQQAKPTQHQGQAPAANRANQAKPVAHQQQGQPTNRPNQANPEKRQAQAKPQTQPVQHPQQMQSVNRAKQAKPAAQTAHQNPMPQAQQAKQADRGGSEGQQHAQRSAAEVQRQRAEPSLRLSARGSGRIPDERFRSSFGRAHAFRMGTPTMVGGYSRFQYGGYWFGFVQPWPVDWYYTDDVYVDYIGGAYYLFNPSYPGARIAITVAL